MITCKSIYSHAYGDVSLDVLGTMIEELKDDSVKRRLTVRMSNADGHIVLSLSEDGKFISDLFSTIRRFNELDVLHGSTLVDGEHHMNEYVMLDCLRWLLTPVIVTVGDPFELTRCADLALGSWLEFPQTDILTPSQFKDAQIFLLKCVNKKRNSVDESHFKAVTREPVFLTGTTALQYAADTSSGVSYVEGGHEQSHIIISPTIYQARWYDLQLTETRMQDMLQEHVIFPLNSEADNTRSNAFVSSTK